MEVFAGRGKNSHVRPNRVCMRSGSRGEPVYRRWPSGDYGSLSFVQFMPMHRAPQGCQPRLGEAKLRHPDRFVNEGSVLGN